MTQIEVYGPRTHYYIILQFTDDTLCQFPICTAGICNLVFWAQSISSTAEDQVILPNDLSNLTVWEGRWNMCFHPDKCKVLSITVEEEVLPWVHLSWPDLQVNQQHLLFGKCVRLTYRPHINMTNKASTRAQGLLIRTQWSAPLWCKRGPKRHLSSQYQSMQALSGIWTMLRWSTT